MRPRALLISLLVALAVGAGAASTAWSTPVTVTFPGTVRRVDDTQAVLDPPVSVGDPFVVSYTLDGDAAVSDEWCRSNFCRYVGAPEGSFVLSVLISGRTITATNPTLIILNFGNDIWALDVVGEEALILVTFIDPYSRRLSDASFFVNESLEGWLVGQLEMRVRGPGGCSAGVFGPLIPEPTPLALLLPALVGVAVWARCCRPGLARRDL